MIDNGDGVVQAEELNLLNKITLYIDSKSKNTSGDGVLQEDEIAKFVKDVKKGKIDINHLPTINNDGGNTERQPWSEGLDREIGTIKFTNTEKYPYIKDAIKDVIEIGKEQGFEVEFIKSGNDIWIEDSSIRRADNQIYIPFHSSPNEKDTIYNSTFDEINVEFKSERGNKNNTGHGRVILEGNSFDLEINNKEKYYGTSYLEGGNVLNACDADGKATAIIGESSIGFTLKFLNLENTPENVEKAKELIAKDLGLEIEQVTFIPQYDFHIDMLYRPLHNGEIAIPDFDEAIRLLKENDIPSLNGEETDEIESLVPKFGGENVTPKDELIESLEKLRDRSADIRQEAEDKLTEAGYKLVKIPCFTDSSHSSTNFMNGVGGTSSKTGETFYITNNSEYPELQDIVVPYLKAAGIDKVYFVRSCDILCHSGGIDCITQETPK